MGVEWWWTVGRATHNFQLGGYTIGNALLASDLDCCQHAFASGAHPRLLLGCLQRHTPDPSWKSVGDTPILRSSDTKMNPPFQNPGYGPVNNGRAPMTSAWLWPYLFAPIVFKHHPVLDAASEIYGCINYICWLISF